ncbi:YchJ family metal-binding protein [Streptomyces sp. NBC_01498]|uniref:YchJ family protein n=1 Tax=Streptomyces sp. NBC_01498 TaxID=2975870 RepID=UPI002E7BB171|nr:YchJ family metal-binding protein [Streptomyces sp. NBC_01498]WTL23702.1 YchJ family metal-binding protein [Streptomyces sp. NBC_01498]
MVRRPARPTRPSAGPRTSATPPASRDASPCLCGLPASYGECCGRFHSALAAAPTAERLMRARYSAFAVGDEPYLIRSWHPVTRPSRVDLDAAMRWAGLEILATTDGSAFHTTGTVTFRARYTRRGERGTLHERSRFERHDGAWVYVEGTFVDD